MNCNDEEWQCHNFNCIHHVVGYDQNCAAWNVPWDSDNLPVDCPRLKDLKNK